MNIIKLKDILMDKTNTAEGVPDNVIEFFNEKLKGKYAYWVHLRYIYPLDDLEIYDYIRLEQLSQYDNQFIDDTNGNNEDNIIKCIDMITFSDSSDDNCASKIVDFMDKDITEKINSISIYKALNSYSCDSDIDINDIKKFRTWLAKSILKLNFDDENDSYSNGISNLSNEQIYMLEYYANNKYNEVIKQLSLFGAENPIASIKYNTNWKCSCCDNENTPYAYSIGSSCNAMDIYVKNIHTCMVNTFKDIEFWTNINNHSSEFIKLFKQYIDNIIKVGLFISTDTDIKKPYKICSCNENIINTNNEILKKLSVSLEHIINYQAKDHINFIHDALYNWAEHLYDRMQW